MLAQANTDGVLSTLLLQKDGALLSVTGENKAEDMIGALVTNLWKAYSEGPATCLGADQLYFSIVACEEGTLAVAEISRFLLCMYGDGNVSPGMLKIKMDAMLGALKNLKDVFPFDD
mmetsp:Transcript_22104/g.31278  ORF Transcript_22104/g.31278 Transcript_22104/m.31278 type:complete len:117 (+) Transcript_22104:60-410(+)